MLRRFRRRPTPSPAPTRDDLRIRNLLDDPALRRAVGLDTDVVAVPLGHGRLRSPLLTQLGLDDLARRRRTASPDRVPTRFVGDAAFDRLRHRALEDAAA